MFWTLAALNVASTLTVPLAGLIDTALLGHLPSEVSLAGVALGSIVFDYLFWTFGFLKMATTGLAAGSVGRGDREESHALLWRASLMGGLVGGCLWFALPWVHAACDAWIPGADGVRIEAADYIFTRLLGAPASLANFALAGWLLGTGRSGRALLLASIQNVGNACLSAWLILGMDMSAAGAGLGTAMSQWLAWVVVVVTLPGSSRRRPPWSLIRDRRRLRELFGLGGDITVRTICLVTAMSAFTAAGSLFGPAVLAGQAVLMRVLSLFSYVVDGFAHAVETVAGQRDAAGDAPGVRRALRRGLWAGGLLTAALAGTMMIAPEAVLGLLTDIPEVRDHAVVWLPATLACAMAGSFAYIFDGLFVGTARGRDLRNTMLVSFGLVFAPLFAWALYQRSLPWLWAALGGFLAARALTQAWVLLRAGHSTASTGQPR